jgi:hypothetical protein
LVHYLTCSWWLIAVQEVWQSLSLSCSLAEQPSHSRREKSASFIAPQTVRFGFLSWYYMSFGSENLLAHCSLSLACWQRLWSIVCDISRGLPRYIVSNIICSTKMLKMLHLLLPIEKNSVGWQWHPDFQLGVPYIKLIVNTWSKWLCILQDLSNVDWKSEQCICIKGRFLLKNKCLFGGANK